MSTATRPARRYRPSSDTLEPRVPPSGVPPTAYEQLYLELLNDARFDPASYATTVARALNGAANYDVTGFSLNGIAPSQPMAFDARLIQAARSHSRDMIARSYFAHDDPDGNGPDARERAAGYPSTGYAESINSLTQYTLPGRSFQINDDAAFAAYSLADLIVDDGIPDVGHRVMLLDIGGRFAKLRQAGIGLASQDFRESGLAGRTSDATVDFGSTRDSRAFVTGVVFNDGDGDGKYDIGEGLGGVRIRVKGQGSTSTFDTGGYSLALKPGTYTVTASGGGLASPIQRTIVVGKAGNVRLNLMPNPNGPSFQAKPRANQAVTLATLPGGASAPIAARIDWGDGKASTGALSDNGRGGSTLSGSHPYARRGTYEIRALVTNADGTTTAVNAVASIKPGGRPR